MNDNYHTGWTRNKIIEKIAGCQKVKRMAGLKGFQSYVNDMLQEHHLIYCKLPDEKLHKLISTGEYLFYSATIFENLRKHIHNIKVYNQRHVELNPYYDIPDQAEENEQTIKEQLLNQIPQIKQLINDYWHQTKLTRQRQSNKNYVDYYLQPDQTQRTTAKHFKVPAYVVNQIVKPELINIKNYVLSRLTNTDFYDQL